MNVAFIGNFEAEHSTENDLLHALGEHGATVHTTDERIWHDAKTTLPEPDGFDLLLWVHTHGWPTTDAGVAEVERFRHAGIPVVGYHLDRWWGLRRQSQVYSTPYFELMDRFYVADPQVRHWRSAFVDAVWTPPAVSTRHKLQGERSKKWERWDIAFVGNTSTGYHPEHTHRRDLLDHMRKRYGRRFVEIPGANRPAIRGDELADIYATIPVIVGDSCLVGLDSYWSDRVPETLGRGGRLLHPDTDWADQYVPGLHLDVWRLGDWDGLDGWIDATLERPDDAKVIAERGRAHTLAHHTYTHRIGRVLEDVTR